MKPKELKITPLPKVFFLVLFFFCLFFGFKVFAVNCDLEGWNNSACTVDIHYEDPSGGGSNLAECKYAVISGTPPDCSTVGSWINTPSCSPSCSGATSCTCPVTISVSSIGDCNVNGEAVCTICSKAVDTAGNVGYGGKSLDIDYQVPTTNIQCNGEACLAGWYNTDVSVTLTCSDSDSGCDKIYYCKGQIEDCSLVEYSYTGPVSFDFTAEGTNYVRYYSTDIAGNVEQPTKLQSVKIDKTGPQSEFTDVATPPADSNVANNFNVSVSDWDRPLGTAGTDNSGLFNCYYSVYDSGAGWTRSGTTRNCNSDSSFTVTVGPTGYCRTVGGSCTVYVYAYDNALNPPGSGQSRTFNISYTIGEQYNLFISSTAGGSVTVPGEGTFGPYDEGTGVNLVAEAVPNYQFVNWTGDTGTISDPNSANTQIYMYGNYSITANFELIPSGACAAGETEVIKEITTWSSSAVRPFYRNYDAIRFQALYLQSEINQAGYINKVYLQKYNSNTGTFNNLRIYLCHSSLSNLGTTFNSNCKDALVNVFGPTNVTLSGSANTWMEFNVANTFYYNNTDNLIVEIRWNGDTGSTVDVSAGTVSDYRSLYSSNDLATAGARLRTAYNFRTSICVPPPADATPPTVGEISPLYAVVNVAETFSADVSDNIAVTNCQLFIDDVDNGAMSLSLSPCPSCTASKSHTFPAIGGYSLYARCRDQAGNYNNGPSVMVLVTAPDPNPPTVEVIADPPEVKTIWQNTDAVASVSCTDTGSGCNTATYRLKSYNSNPGTCSNVYSEYNLEDFYTVDYYQWVCGAAKDFAGNEGFSNTPVEFKVDKRTPSTNFVPPTPTENSWHRNDFTAKVMDSDMGGSGLKSGFGCKYQVIDIIEGGDDVLLVDANRPCGEYSFNVPVGEGTFECHEDRIDPVGQPTCRAITIAYDNAGNSKTTVRDFSVDYTSPTVGEITPLTATQGVEETFTASLVDTIGQISGCWLYIDNWGSPVSAQINISPIPCANGTNCSVSADYTFTSSGNYQMRFACGDLAGNYGWGNPVTVSVAEGSSPGAPVITSLSYYSCSCPTPDQQCTDQFSCCTTPTTQTGCCVKFNITATDPDGDPLTYNWDFRDGSPLNNNEDPSYHYSNPNTYNVIIVVSDGTNITTGGIIVTVVNPTLSANLTANPAFGIDSLSGVSLRAIVSGSMFGKVNYYFDCNLGNGDCTSDGVYSDCDQQATNQITADYTTLPLCNYVAAINPYTAKVLTQRGTGNAPATAEIRVAEEPSGVCTPGEQQNTTCTSSQGCNHTLTITCTAAGNWPSWPACPIDDCTIGEVRGCGTCGSQVCGSSCTWGSCSGGGVCSPGADSSECPCPPSGCINGDYYEYPAYGDCIGGCVCNTGTASGQPCQLTFHPNDSSCNQPPSCNYINAVPISISVGDIVSFTGDVSDSDGTIIAYEWDFNGDGNWDRNTPLSGTTYTYNVAGTYCAKVRAQDDGGLWSETPNDCPVTCAQEITVSANQSPTADMYCGIGYCDGFGCYCNGSWETYHSGNDIFNVYNNSTDPDNNIIQSTWSIIGHQAPFLICQDNPGTPAINEGLCDLGSMPITPPNIYTIQLVVEDERGLTDSDFHQIRVKQDAIADFMCSLTNEEGSWQDCQGLTATEGEIVYFKDSPDLGDHSTWAEDATVINSRTWKRNESIFAPGGDFGANETNPYIKLEEGPNTIQLSITDNMNRSDSQEYTINGRPSLPEWKEIPPL